MGNETLKSCEENGKRYFVCSCGSRRFTIPFRGFYTTLIELNEDNTKGDLDFEEIEYDDDINTIATCYVCDKEYNLNEDNGVITALK